MKRAVVLLVWMAGIAHAERPLLVDEATHGTANVLVHYATSGGDAPPAGDRDADGVPDFVAEVAREAQAAHARFVAMGFATPLADTLGGDARVDIYLRDLTAADGNAGVDGCAGGTCVGYIVAENDYVGYAYPSVTEGIRSVVPHELFHLVQYAYATNQPTTWTEGTAVWAVEVLYGDGNRDFERFAPSFLSKTYRPYERGAGGFGDGYPYGAALWPMFLSARYGTAIVVDVWARCHAANALDATHEALVTRGSSFDAAWIAFTRENARRTPLPPREAVNASRVHIEGWSARYVPLALATRTHLRFATTARIAAAADAIELDVTADAEPVVLEPGAYVLTITGLSRGTLATPVDITYGTPPVEVADGGGCGSTPRPSSVVPFVLLALLAVATRAPPRR